MHVKYDNVWKTHNLRQNLTIFFKKMEKKMEKKVNKQFCYVKVECLYVYHFCEKVLATKCYNIIQLWSKFRHN